VPDGVVFAAYFVGALAVVAFAAVCFFELVTWCARRRVRRYLDEHPPLPQLGPDGEL